MMFGIFNVVFLPMFYKTAYKVGTPYLVFCAAMTLFVVIAEVVINIIPAWKAALDTTNLVYFPQQITVFLLGIVILALLTTLAGAKSEKQFEKLDL